MLIFQPAHTSPLLIIYAQEYIFIQFEVIQALATAMQRI